MSERDVINSIIDFSFIIKAQLHSEDTALLRSILSIAIMEAEDLVEKIDEENEMKTKRLRRASGG